MTVYFPPGLWYDLKSHAILQSTVGQRVKLDCPLTDIKLYVRSGHVLVTQQPKVTTEETRKGNFELLVALDSNGTASGSLYWDSGDGLNTLKEQKYDLIEFYIKNVIRTLQNCQIILYYLYYFTEYSDFSSESQWI